MVDKSTGLEGEPSGLVKCAGGDADSFYSWQRHMEGLSDDDSGIQPPIIKGMTWKSRK